MNCTVGTSLQCLLGPLEGVYYVKMAARTSQGHGDMSDVITVNMADWQPAVTGAVTSLVISERQMGIVIGSGIGVTCLIICVIVLLLRFRCATPHRYHHCHHFMVASSPGTTATGCATCPSQLVTSFLVCENVNSNGKAGERSCYLVDAKVNGKVSRSRPFFGHQRHSMAGKSVLCSGADCHLMSTPLANGDLHSNGDCHGNGDCVHATECQHHSLLPLHHHLQHHCQLAAVSNGNSVLHAAASHATQRCLEVSNGNYCHGSCSTVWTDMCSDCVPGHSRLTNRQVSNLLSNYIRVKEQ